MRARTIGLALLLLGVLVAGCGQKGDLYLPPEDDEPREEGED